MNKRVNQFCLFGDYHGIEPCPDDSKVDVYAIDVRDFMKTKTKPATTVAARIAGEDLRTGDYVTILSQIYEIPSYLWCSSGVGLAPDEPVRSRYLPRSAAGEPNKVVAICLPFVYVKRPRGTIVGLDTRQQQIVRLDRDNGRLIWKRMRKSLNKKSKSQLR